MPGASSWPGCGRRARPRRQRAGTRAGGPDWASRAATGRWCACRTTPPRSASSGASSSGWRRATAPARWPATWTSGARWASAGITSGSCASCRRGRTARATTPSWPRACGAGRTGLSRKGGAAVSESQRDEDWLDEWDGDAEPGPDAETPVERLRWLAANAKGESTQVAALRVLIERGYDERSNVDAATLAWVRRLDER